MKLSAIILTKNEEKKIGRAIKSVSFADEVIVVDDGSTDKTPAIAKKLGAVVAKRSLAGDFASQRNFGIKKAQGPWILMIDADEVVGELLAKEIVKAVKREKEANGFLVRRDDIFADKRLRHGEWGGVYFPRLFKKGKGVWKREVHEELAVEGKMEKIKGVLFHYAHDSVADFLEGIRVFSLLHAKAKKKEGKKSSIYKIIFLPIAKFIQNYFLRLGFLDGVPGIIYAFFMSFHSFLAWSELYLNEKNL